MRERTTWDRNSIIASVKKAEDPRAMNQDHLQQQPPADKYVTGGPSEFAEDVHPSGNTWEAEYDASGTTERNAIGMPEMRGDTYNHPERTASLDENLVVKKADLCVSIARKMLGKTASEQALEDQALSLMYLPDADLIGTANRLAGVVAADDDDDDEDDDEQGQQEEQQGQKQAQQQEEKKQGQQQEEEKKQGQQQQEEEQQGQKQAQQQQEEKKQGQQQEEEKKQGQQQEEQGQKQASLQQLAQNCVQAMQQGDLQAAQQQIVEMLQQATQQQAGQNQQYMAQQLQQMIQQAMQQGQQQPVQQQQAQQVQQVQEQALPPSDDQLLAQMLAPEMAQQGQPQQGQMLMADDEIQLDGPVMDVGETVLGSSDDILQTLFAADNQVVETPKSTPVRTASTRTVGTHPTQGVAKLGGGPSSNEGSDVDKLSSLWASAPDVSNVFRS